MNDSGCVSPQVLMASVLGLALCGGLSQDTGIYRHKRYRMGSNCQSFTKCSERRAARKEQRKAKKRGR